MPQRNDGNDGWTTDKTQKFWYPQSTPDTAQPNTKSYKQHHLPVSEAMQSVQTVFLMSNCKNSAL